MCLQPNFSYIFTTLQWFVTKPKLVPYFDIARLENKDNCLLWKKAPKRII